MPGSNSSPTAELTNSCTAPVAFFVAAALGDDRTARLAGSPPAYRGPQYRRLEPSRVGTIGAFPQDHRIAADQRPRWPATLPS